MKIAKKFTNKSKLLSINMVLASLISFAFLVIEVYLIIKSVTNLNPPLGTEDIYAMLLVPLLVFVLLANMLLISNFKNNINSYNLIAAILYTLVIIAFYFYFVYYAMLIILPVAILSYVCYIKEYKIEHSDANKKEKNKIKKETKVKTIDVLKHINKKGRHYLPLLISGTIYILFIVTVYVVLSIIESPSDVYNMFPHIVVSTIAWIMVFMEIIRKNNTYIYLACFLYLISISLSLLFKASLVFPICIVASVMLTIMAFYALYKKVKK